jgi:ketosteroid isomerase-like protein
MSEESTTPDLAERVQAFFVVANRGNLRASMAFFADDAVYDNAPYGLGTYAGRSKIAEFTAEWFSSYEAVVFTVEEVLDLGRGVVFAVVRQDARVLQSSARVGLRYAAVIEWAGELILRWTAYIDIDEARGAAERLADERG